MRINEYRRFVVTQILFILILAMGFEVAIYMMLHITVDSATLRLLLFMLSVLCSCFVVAYFLIFVSQRVFFDCNGVHAYRIVGRNIFISWESITKVLLVAKTSTGKTIFVFNDEHDHISYKHRFTPNGSEAVFLQYDLKFAEALKEHRPDIEVSRQDSF